LWTVLKLGQSFVGYDSLLDVPFVEPLFDTRLRTLVDYDFRRNDFLPK
jgi:hypothetical protein